MVVNAVVRTEPSEYWLQDIGAAESDTGSGFQDDGADEVAEIVDAKINCQLICFPLIKSQVLTCQRRNNCVE